MLITKPVFNKKIQRRRKKKHQGKLNIIKSENIHKRKYRKITDILQVNNNNYENYIFLKYIITQVLILFFLVCPITIIFSKQQPLIFKYKKYKIGEIIIIDNIKWYVIKETDILEDYLVLLSETDLDLNQDGKLDKKDKTDFNSINDIIENDIKTRFSNERIKNIRLLTSEEYIFAREAMEFGYDWKTENFLAGESKGKWWLNTEKYGKILSVNTNGTYNMNDSTDKNFIRPVIEILKFNIN